MVLRKLKIGARLAAGFGIILLVLAAVTVLSTLMEKYNRDRLTETIAAANAKEQLAVEMKLLALEQSSSLRNLVLLADPKSMAAENERIKSLATSLDVARGRLMKFDLSPNERKVLGSIAAIDAEFDVPIKTAFEYASIFRTEDTGNLLLRTIDPLVQRQLEE